jgi:uncharacterized protein YfcZ (UPF0381/DUF406 family)
MSNDILKECSEQCGCTAEIGTVIGENDTEYTFELKGAKDDVEALYQKYLKVAKDVDESVKVQIEESTDNADFVLKGTFTFSCSAEKLIFQMKSGAL